MTSEKSRALLIVEDDLALQKQIKWSLDRFESVAANDRESALVQARRHQPAVVTMDLGLPPDADSVSEGFKLLEQLLSLDGDMKVIVLTGQNDQANALRAVAMGAYDFFAKPFEPELLNLTVERAFRLAELQAENKRLQLMHQPDALAGLTTRDPGMLRVCRTIEKVASSNVTVMLLGESGTGKEVLARGLHQASPRKGGRFVAINCAAIPENLLESELFGYEKGAFTGAAKMTLGKIETGQRRHADARRDRRPAVLAAGQAAALPAGAHHRAHRRAPGDPGRCAHRLRHAPGPESADQGKPLPRRPVLPPGRDRGRHSAAALAGGRRGAAGPCLCAPLCPGAEPRHADSERRRGARHRAHTWPGNIRELENCIKRASIMADGNQITRDDLGLAPPPSRRCRPIARPAHHPRRGRTQAPSSPRWAGSTATWSRRRNCWASAGPRCTI